MPRVSHTATVHAPVGEVWDFVRAFDNWAGYISGYQSHEIVSDTKSTWGIKGNAGAITRTVTFEVEIVDWVEGEHVDFTLTGVSEPLTGTGRFTTSGGDDGAPVAAPVPVPRSGIAKLREKIGRWLHRRLLRPRSAAAAVVAPASPSDAATTLTFDLELAAGGMMAPMINPMLEPMLAPVAEDLATSLTREIERRHA